MNKILRNAMLGIVAAASIGIGSQFVGRSVAENRANTKEAIQSIRNAMVKEIDVEIERKIELGMFQKLFVNITGSRDEQSREADARTRARLWLRDNKRRLYVEVEHPDMGSYAKNPFSPTTYLFKVIDTDNREPIVTFRLDDNKNPVDVAIMENSAFIRELKGTVETAAR
jgi:hypothetical protein